MEAPDRARPGLHPLYGTSPAAPARPSTQQLEMLIMRVQTALMMRGYDPGPIDGKLGGNTTEALMLFQTESGLSSTGRLDARTCSITGITTE